jgi:hypothetical protein
VAAEPGSRPEQQLFEDPAVDRLMGVLMALATDHYVLRDRVRALEGELAKAGNLDIAALDAEPSEAELAISQLDRTTFAEALLKPLLGEQQAKGATGTFSLKKK